MKRFVVSAFCAAMLLCTGVRAETIKMTPEQIRSALDGVVELAVGYKRVLRDGQKETGVEQQFDFGPGMFDVIYTDISALRDRMKTIQESVKAVQKRYGAADGSPEEIRKRKADLDAELEAFMSTPIDVDHLVAIRDADLKREKNTQLSPLTLVKLGPLYRGPDKDASK